MIAELSAAVTAIKESTGLIQIIFDAKTDAEVKITTNKLLNQLLTLQAECFSLGEMIHLRNEEIVHLKAIIAEFENFKTESEGYELCKTEGGSLVYTRNVSVKEEQVTVNACPHCFHQKKISMLQPGMDTNINGSYWVHSCPSCSNSFTMGKTGLSIRC